MCRTNAGAIRTGTGISPSTSPIRGRSRHSWPRRMRRSPGRRFTPWSQCGGLAQDGLLERLGILNGALDAWRGVFELTSSRRWPARGFAPALHRGQGRSSTSPPSPATPSTPSPARLQHLQGGALGADPRNGGGIRRLGVRVNAVAPGEIETEMVGPEYEPDPASPCTAWARRSVAAAVFQLSAPISAM